uniref:Uncharacterized protein n=1 Tax=Rhizophora mucronata TaxID=61149 RepID=A0A2P2PMA8_RHIMU
MKASYIKTIFSTYIFVPHSRGPREGENIKSHKHIIFRREI